MKKIIKQLMLVMTILFAGTGICQVSAAGQEVSNLTEISVPIQTPMPTSVPVVTPTPAPVKVKPGWIYNKKTKKYYWRQKNGKIRKKKGFFYYNKHKYYINSDGSAKTGKQKIGKNWYYFNEKGCLYRNRKLKQLGGKYYTITINGVLTSVSNAKARCTIETRKFIAKYTKPSMTKSQKFRACYNQLLWYMHYRPKSFNAKDFAGKDWPYKWALSVYDSSLTGNCYGFACCVAACAKELGYTPYVIVTTGDHGFVMIDGLYYDNMGGKFGVSYHAPYNIYKKVKF